MRRQVAVVASLAVVLTTARGAMAVPTVDAGADATISVGEVYALQGTVDLSPLEFWVADGNGATEDMLIKYNEWTGITAVGPITSNENPPRVFGFPSDLQRVGSLIYGIETYHRQFYVLNPDTGLATVLGPKTVQTELMSLAYDPASDRMYAIDVASDKLVWINRYTGATANVGLIGAVFGNTRALAFDRISGLLYAADYNKTTKLTTLYTIHPANVRINVVMVLPTNAMMAYDELDFYRDELYGVLSIGPGLSCQVQHIDLETGVVTNVGPIIPNVSAHSLVMQSMPEVFEWSVVSGPGVVSFADAGAADSAVTFSEPGTYVLALTVFADDGPLTDTVTIDVIGGCATDSDGDGVADCLDECPLDAAKTVVGICGCGVADSDADGDGTPDCQDGCPVDAGWIEPGMCGCGVVEVDGDGDNVPDCIDGCPHDSLKASPGVCGCGVADVDSDEDGVADCNDACPEDPLKTVADLCGCGAPPPCDDDNACTQDSCDPNLGCVHVDISGLCNDGLFCNGVETCDPLTGCVAGVDPCNGDSCNENTDTCGASAPKLWMVLAGLPSLPGVGVVEPCDIVSYDPAAGVWALEFRGGDVGLSGQRINGFARWPTGELLLSFDNPLNIPGLIGGPGGVTLVDDSDIVMFTPTSAGLPTVGVFTFYFDGSDVGLTADNEDIDSIALTPDGRLVLSTIGAVIAPGISGSAQDLFVMNATSLGSVTAGSFAMYVMGSSVGLSTSTENVAGSSILLNGNLLLSTTGPFAVAGLSGTNKEVMQFAPTMLGAGTQGTFSLFLATMPLGVPSTARVAELEWVP